MSTGYIHSLIFWSEFVAETYWSERFKYAEAATRTCYVKKVFLKISRNSPENTCARVSFLIMLQAWGLRSQLEAWLKCNVQKTLIWPEAVTKGVLKNTFFEKYCKIYFTVALLVNLQLLGFNFLVFKLWFVMLSKSAYLWGVSTQLTFNCSNSTIRSLENRSEICLKLTIKTPEWRQWRRSGVLLLTLNIFHTFF